MYCNQPNFSKPCEPLLLPRSYSFNESRTRFYTSQIALAIEYLQTNNIIYRSVFAYTYAYSRDQT